MKGQQWTTGETFLGSKGKTKGTLMMIHKSTAVLLSAALLPRLLLKVQHSRLPPVVCGRRDVSCLAAGGDEGAGEPSRPLPGALRCEPLAHGPLRLHDVHAGHRWAPPPTPCTCVALCVLSARARSHLAGLAMGYYGGKGVPFYGMFR